MELITSSSITFLPKVSSSGASGKSHKNHIQRVPRIQQQRLSSICNFLDGLIDRFDGKNSVPNMFSGNLEPVAEECAPEKCLEITGELPVCLWGGAYVRNGSNPKYYSAAGCHSFDGDGMLHLVKFHGSRSISYSCRSIRTSRFQQEEAAVRKLYPKSLGEFQGFVGLARIALSILRSFLGLMDFTTNGYGTANTGLTFFDNLFLTLNEIDKPHAVRVTEDGDLETLGIYDFKGQLSHCMTAHPKVDPDTGDMFAFANKFFLPPYFIFFSVSNDGTKRPGVPIASLKVPVMIHDFAITKNYVIIPGNQLVFRIGNMFKGSSPIKLERDKLPSIGIIPKYATNEAQITWFELPELMCMHYVNAWEEDDEVVVLASAVDAPEKLLSDLGSMHCSLIELRINLRSHQTSMRRLSSTKTELHQLNPKFVGKKIEYLYSAVGSWPKFHAIEKIAVTDHSVLAHKAFRAGCFASEPVFVPRSKNAIEEDDGYLVCYVHDENARTADLLVMDAKSTTLKTVASVRLPRRVPYGFHAMFLSGEQLSQQKDVTQHEHGDKRDKLSNLLRFLHSC